ncbi:helix-turn-helix domain-containing protein [Micromonospora sp. NPDC048986]|uniref:helix-turn-helix domain-containing protein n=1 Tax=Micromonospora sp. NPDC048986 TaxID=3155644 RepID=UPI0033E0AD38
MPDPDRGAAFARLIVEGRKRLRWRQEDLVEASGVSRRTLTRWEGGDASTADSEKVRAVCLALGINPVHAAIALGYVTEEELDRPVEPVQQFEPTVEEIIAMFKDPNVPEKVKFAGLQYLRFLRNEDGPGSDKQTRAS